MGGAKAHYDGIVAFSQTDFTEDLKVITVPVLVMHGDDDQIVPYARLRPAVGEAPEERDAEDLCRLPARHAHDPGGDDQRRPAGVHREIGSRRAAGAGRLPTEDGTSGMLERSIADGRSVEAEHRELLREALAPGRKNFWDMVDEFREELRLPPDVDTTEMIREDRDRR